MEIHSVQDAEKQDAILTFVFVSGGHLNMRRRPSEMLQTAFFLFTPTCVV